MSEPAISAWGWWKCGPTGSAANMSWDEALLEAMPRLGFPVFRLYAWIEPAATFGYFQHYGEVARLTALRPLIRRPTGGGIVPHDADWTYSLAFPDGAEWYGLKATGSYERVHRWISRAFQQLGFDTVLAPKAIRAQPGQCFVGCEASDVLWRGRKIAGAAQRRTRAGLLIQGSVQPPPGLARPAWEESMRAVASAEGALWKTFQADERLQQRAEELESSKYSLSTYNQKR